jgi:DNA-binding NtrC family response regulator
MKILLVDDTKSIRISISAFLQNLGHMVLQANNGREALDILDKEQVHIVVSDIRMPYVNGHELLKRIKKSDKMKDIEVVLLTGHGDIKGAINAMKEGANDYLLKPINLDEFAGIINRIGELLSLKEENLNLTRNFDQKVNEATQDIKKELDNVRQAFAKEVGTAQIVVFSDSLREILKKAEKLHQNPDIPVFIEGETGTGKEVIARYIHYGKGEVTTPFIALNCAAITSTLFESELFGYEPGAFTGGNPNGQKGKLELSETGSIFLDEITEMPIEHQAKLLRIIQERNYYKIGGLKRMTTTSRFICATNQNVERKIKDGTFRQDLFFRLNIGHIRIPPLRERPEEIMPLAQMFLDNMINDKRTMIRSISDPAKKKLEEYNWPGNVRELKNAVERVALFGDEKEIKPKQLNFLSEDGYSDPSGLSELLTDEFTIPEEPIDFNKFNLKIVQKTLEKFNGNKTDAAKYMGISRRAIYTYLKNIED